jgi:hypothetical integral membrane protein (TIGR02206 family)
VASFPTFGPAHLGVLAAVLVAAAALGAAWHRWPRAAWPLRRAIAAALALNELGYYGFAISQGWVDPPRGLPLDLCDLTLWLAVVVLVRPRPWACDAAYYLAAAGSGMAVLTPDPGVALATYPGAKFFLSHGGVVAAVLGLVLSGAVRPRPGSWWRVLLAVNGYAAALLAFDLRLGTNYMYLVEKPASGTLLDVLGPWPWYLLAGDAVAAALFWLLQLPFRRRAGEERPAARAARPDP